MANGLNANLLRRWVVKAGQQPRKAAAQIKSGTVRATTSTQAVASFVPVKLQASAPKPDIRIELNRNGTAVTVSWPTSGAAECAA